MSQFGRGYDINQTFVIESQSNDLPVLSACTVVYTNFLQSCSGDTQIFLGTGVVSINGNITTNSVSATTYFGDGSNLTGISTQDTFVTGGTYSNGVTTFTNNTGGTFNVTGFSTGYTLTNSEIISVLGYVPLSAYTDVFVTGGTYNNAEIIFTNNTGGTFSVSGISSGGGSIFTGGTVIGFAEFLNGLSALTISATTYYGDGSNLTGISTQDTFVTGGTHDKNSGVSTFTNNTGGTFNVSGYFTPSDDIFTTGLTFNSGTYDLNIVRNDGSAFSTNLAILASDIYVTGGTYNAGTATFTNNTGGTFTVTGFSTTSGGSSTFTGGTVTGPTIFVNGLSANTFSATTYLGLPLDVYVTGSTYVNNSFTFTNNSGGTFSVNFNILTGLSITNNLVVSGDTNLNGQISSNSLSGSTNRLVQVNSGGTFSASQEIINAYLTSGSTVANLLDDVSNWDINGNYTGTTISGTFQGQKYYNSNYFFEAVQDNLFIRLIRG